MEHSDAGGASVPLADNRRQFLSRCSSTTVMAGGLATSYGTLGLMAGRYLYPAGGTAADWQFVAPVAEVGLGDSRVYVAPSGAKVVIARQGEKDEPESFIALSSVCPHLGCQVHWEPAQDRFFCPCHNGAFDPSGKPIAGPPLQGDQQLTRFPLKIESGLLYVLVPLKSVTG